ncbi:hypothetical protein PENSPDRAFT_614381 [Peniophora sp. CONT]|nr:hypothetical protein PENSPDRAFT_614381 [Peniophora sp. CONT]
MHSVLLIDEILRAVFAQLREGGNPNSEFARLATICQAWKEPVLDYLWETLPSTEPLLALLPTLKRENGAYVLSADPSPEALANLSAYASRVRSVQHHGRTATKLPSAILELLASSSGLFLPSLSTVALNLSDPTKRTLAPQLYLSTQLRSVTIDVGFARRAAAGTNAHPGESVCAYVDAISQSVPRLESLNLRGRVGERILDSVAEMQNLRTLSLCVGTDLSPRIIAAIGLFPHLHDLRVQLDGMDEEALRDALTEAGPCFAALKTLNIRAVPEVMAAFFGSFPKTARLSSARLESDLKPRAADSWIPALEHLATKASFTLEELSIQSLTSFCEVLDPTVPPRLHFTIATLAPLERATCLRRFFLDASVPADMNDADFGALARWWPCIEHLGLWTKPVDAFDYPTYFTMQPRATPASLRAFSEVCGRLRSLSVPMDISAVPSPAQPSTPAAEGNQRVLESIIIGCAKKGPDVDADELAACLYNAFPRVKRIEFDCGEETAWPDVADAYARLQAAAVL